MLIFHFSISELLFEGMADEHPFGFGKEWRDYKDCPKDSFIDGFYVRYHPLIGMTGINLFCSTKKGNIVSELVNKF